MKYLIDDNSVIHDYFSVSEVWKIITISRADNHTHSIWFKLLYNFGITITELTNLKVNDFDFQKLEVKIQASKKLRHRTLKIPVNLIYDLKILIHNRKENEFLFYGRNSKKIHMRTVQKALEKIENLTGYSISLTKIRRSFAIHLFQKGWEEKKIASILGHSSTRATRKLVGNSRLFYMDLLFPLDELTNNLSSLQSRV